MAAVDTVEVRPGRVEDIEAARACVDVVARERAWLGMLEAPPLEESQNFWGGLIEQKHPFLLACDGEAVVGWCDVRGVPRAIFAHVGVLGMGLLPAYRGRGIGTRLMSATLDRARRCFERVELEVFAHNARAQRLYEKLGFTVEGVRVRAAKIDGRYIDSISMAVLFAAADGT